MRTFIVICVYAWLAVLFMLFAALAGPLGVLALILVAAVFAPFMGRSPLDRPTKRDR